MPDAEGRVRSRPVKVRVTFTVEIDPQAWTDEYGVEGIPEIQEDVQRHIENIAREHLNSVGVLSAPARTLVSTPDLEAPDDRD